VTQFRVTARMSRSPALAARAIVAMARMMATARIQRRRSGEGEAEAQAEQDGV
jgi:hypothetical protein